jgi:hypothetical protein
LTSEQQALDVGYEEGREQRKLSGVKDAHCADHRKIFLDNAKLIGLAVHRSDPA